MANTTSTTSREKLYITVNGEKIELTNKVMMAAAVQALEAVNADPAIITKAKMHLAQMVKASASTAGKKSDAQVENEQYAEILYKAMLKNPDASYNLKFVIELQDLPYVMNSSKASQVMQVLVKAGKVTKVSKKSGNAEYVLTRDEE